MSKRYLSLSALVLSFTLLLAGCGSSTPAADNTNGGDAVDAVSENTEKDSVANSDSEIEAANTKLAGYVDCINDHSNRAMDSYDYYVNWANPETGPTGQEQNILGLFTLIHDTKECTDAIAATVKMKPAYAALDKAAPIYAKALTDLDVILKEAHEYYEEKNYLDDAMAKGKEMHPKLMAAFKAFEAADVTVRTELEAITDELDEKELAMLEKDGRTYPYLTKYVMLLAKKLVDEGSVAADKLDQIDLDSFQKNITEYEKAVDELKTYDESHSEELGPGPGADSFISDAGDYLITAKDLMRRARDKTPFDSIDMSRLQSGMGQSVDGSPDKLVEEYNGLVDSHNFMNMF